MRVVIVGGGIVGCASAYYLAERGAEVVVCERSNVGAGSTERSAGGIRAQFSTPVNVALSRASVRVWERFEEEFGTDIAYRRPGYLFLAREEATAEGLADAVAVQNELGVPSELLTPEEAHERCPGLRRESFRAATYSPTDGFSDPHLALQGFAASARESGAEIRTGVEVTDVLREGDAVVGVETTEGRIEAEFVVNAAGPWARRIGGMAGVDLPVVPERRQIAVVEPETPVPESVPLTIDLDTGSYFRPERDGAALVGGHFSPSASADPDAYDRTTDLDWTVEALERAADCATYFGPETRVRRGWAGLYAVTPDHHPIIEETVPGFVNAVGFSGHGFQHAPATGQLVAELVFEGSASLVDISELDGARFAEGRTVEERNVA
ncbi:NAD(P)/FAD-dependent oxidoreductase [Haladaptatus salinisoli]|uniref:NAD(P)/FAD-dependent oxidoreductase n=1 Tax=Haladaptatus salinisoli TaxID=2884876 RepID=UPI001D0BC5F2|nr:FAD-dependent oxidoreductase [Haladaptatus salinisoli]